VFFNRSHYEDVLAVRVHNLAPEDVWHKRFAHINHFENLLHDSGAIVVKFYLHISKAEQEERLLAREENPAKYWKLSPGDWKERALWDEYTRAYEDVIGKCAQQHARGTWFPPITNGSATSPWPKRSLKPAPLQRPMVRQTGAHRSGAEAGAGRGTRLQRREQRQRLDRPRRVPYWFARVNRCGRLAAKPGAQRGLQRLDRLAGPRNRVASRD
jgi:hypothetical protein